MPFHKVRFTGTSWDELFVASEGDAFCWTAGPLSSPALRKAVETVTPPAENFILEVCLSVQEWMSEVHETMTQGVLLALDYGMSQRERLAPHRKDGTAAAYRAHRRLPSLLDSPGESDLTAHVDFTAAARAAVYAGWEVAGYADQHRFFTGLVPLHFSDRVAAPSLEEQRELLSLKTLIHPQLMGVQFKVLGLSKNTATVMEGFRHGFKTREALDL
jgi:SAM-dependent MidA family methyltransferase